MANKQQEKCPNQKICGYYITYSNAECRADRGQQCIYIRKLMVENHTMNTHTHVLYIQSAQSCIHRSLCGQITLRAAVLNTVI